MRLIDADEIPYVEDKAWESNNWRGTYKHAFEKDINKMPTIEAIPISFIREHAELADSVGSVCSMETLMSLICDWYNEKGEEL